MASATIDRRYGLTGDTAIKAPVRVATTAAITLSGEQTIDGVAVVAGDRVLVKDQSSSLDNGIYSAATTAWTRAVDFDGSYDVADGTLIYVTDGTISAGILWQANGTNPILPGTSAMTFTVAAPQFLTTRPHGLRNKIINGCFRFWQRGTSALTPNDNAYGPDRWRVLAEANATVSLARSTSSLASLGAAKAVLTVAIANNKFGIFQAIETETVRGMRGRTVAVQAALKATAGISDVRMAVLEFTGTADSISGDPISSWNAAGTVPTLASNWAYLNTPANLSVGTSFGVETIEATVGASANNLAVMIWSDDKSTTITTDVLEVGYVDLQVIAAAAYLPAFEPAPYAVEYIRCSRFYWKSYDVDTAPGTASGSGVIDGGTGGITSAIHTVRLSVVFPVPMRVIPTVTFYKSDGTAGAWDGASGGVIIVNSGHKLMSVEATTASGTDGRVGGYMTASAEL